MTSNDQSKLTGDIVELGKASELTGLAGEPVRDNGHETPPDYFDASKMQFAPASGEYDI